MKQRTFWLIALLLGWMVWRHFYLRAFRGAAPLPARPAPAPLPPAPAPEPVPPEAMVTPSTALEPATRQALPDNAQMLLDTIPDAPAPDAEPAPGERDALREAVLGDDAQPAGQPEETPASTDDPGGIVAYCVRCKTKRPMVRVSYETTENGRSGARGTCAVCGTGMFTFLKERTETP